jgi:hypothetical protein
LFAGVCLVFGYIALVAAFTLWFVWDWRGRVIGWTWFDRLGFGNLDRAGRLIAAAGCFALSLVLIGQGVTVLLG